MSGVWPLVGRVEELHSIAEAVSDGGGQRGVVITGRAGVGKSRLAREAVATAAAAGWVVRWVVGTVTSRSIPLGAFAAWTDGLDGNPLALVRQVIAAMTDGVAVGRLLVAVDDAHLLDDLSAFVLHQLVLQGVAAVVATIRSGEAAPDAVTALWKERQLGRLELQALSRTEISGLLTAALRGSVDDAAVQRMWELSRGNALFLRELVEQQKQAGRLQFEDGCWRWDGPVEVTDSLVDLVQQQIGAVPDAVRDVVDLVAVGEPLDRTALATLTDPDTLEAAERAQLIIVSDTDAVRVGHPLYGEVRLAQCGPVRLRRLRGRLARALSRPDSQASVDPVQLGVLWLDSDLPPGQEILLNGAQAALLRMDLQNAGRLAGAVVHAGGGIAAQLLYAHTLILLIRSDEAEAVLAGLDASQLPDPMRALYYTVRTANLLWPLADVRASWQLVDTELPGADPASRSTLMTLRALQLVVAARPTEAAEALAEVEIKHLEGLPAIYHSWAAAIAYGDLGKLIRARAAVLAGHLLGGRSPETAHQGVGLTEFHVTGLVLAGAVTEALAAAQVTWTGCVDVRDIPRSVATAIMGMANLGAGELLVAIDQLSSAIDDFERFGDTSGLIYRFSIVYVEALARAGKVAEAQAALKQMLASRHPAFVWVESDALLAQAWLAAAAGRISDARQIATRAAGFAREHSQWAREVWCLQTLTGFGDSTGAPRLGELATVVEGHRAPLAARYAKVLADGDGDALAAVSHDFEALGDRLTAADAAARAAASFTRAQRRGANLTATARARRLTRECGAVFHPDLRLEEADVRFSRREREIVVLVAQGMTNKAIAQTLSLSVRTVEGHLYRLSTRLDLDNRGDLAALLSELDDPPP